MFNMSIKEWVITAVSSVSIIAFTLITSGLKVRTHAPEVSESYEMKRPESSFFSRFDLSGREDHLEVIGEKARQEQAKKAAVQAANTKATDKVNAAKTAAVDPKKKAKDEAAKKKAQAEAARKAKLSVAVVGDSRTGLSKSELAKSTVEGKYSVTTLNAPNTAKANAVKDNVNQEEPQLSAGQWLSLLQNQPSNENAIAFRKAKSYLGNKAYYYDVLAPLLVDSQSDRQTFAYNILKGDISSETFYFISNPTEELKKHEVIYQKVTALYEQYKTKYQFGILSYALSISNTNSNLAALAIVKELYTKIQTQASASGTSVSTAVTTLKVDDLKVFEKLVLKLEASQNESVAQVAKSLYGTVWSTAVVASNSTGI